jgi:hypothetical protein
MATEFTPLQIVLKAAYADAWRERHRRASEVDRALHFLSEARAARDRAQSHLEAVHRVAMENGLTGYERVWPVQPRAEHPDNGMAAVTELTP